MNSSELPLTGLLQVMYGLTTPLTRMQLRSAIQYAPTDDQTFSDDINYLQEHFDAVCSLFVSTAGQNSFIAREQVLSTHLSMEELTHFVMALTGLPALPHSSGFMYSGYPPPFITVMAVKSCDADYDDCTFSMEQIVIDQVKRTLRVAANSWRERCFQAEDIAKLLRVAITCTI